MSPYERGSPNLTYRSHREQSPACAKRAHQPTELICHSAASVHLSQCFECGWQSWQWDGRPLDPIYDGRRRA